MRWLQQMLGKKQVQHDPGRQEALLQDVRHRFGARVQVRVSEQVDAITRLLDGDDGLSVAARVLHEFAEDAHTDLLAQAYELHRRTGRRLIVDRRNYRPLWREAAPALRWSLFELPSGFHPYVQVAAAVTVVGSGASRYVETTDPKPVLTHLFEVLDLTIVGWEYGRVRVDTEAATLAYRLIMAARDIRAAMGDPPPLPPPVRELMRRNNTVDVLDPAGSRVVGGFNPGAEMRAALLA
ncbi:hypothetical protein GCM10017556_42730 [Micromonospora sagamiensis]|uniref:Uncharacterized protein n=2 Tax=Micromonospora sagamiensis TaxID=47875 RepID=A0A562WJQ8_9ACTN|nr:hypothetical protein [Micromonospora sagamiensis]TWJ30436.1 hypothetical protein JD81_03975 [Micromonospora sagamiensis]BCL16534.1 hypothetical protein GCM10017556_42730 [Micromonospora sagamiensis]